MNTTHLSFLLGGMALIVALLLKRLAPGGTARVQSKPLLTRREREVLVMIERAVPHARVYVQVSMGALLRPLGGRGRSESTRARNSFSQKIVDFVIEDRVTGAVLALVELDDRSHNAARDRRRDALTAAAGYRTVRLPAGRLTANDVAGRLAAFAVPGDASSGRRDALGRSKI